MSTIVITGGAAGLGREIAAQLTGRGENAVILDRDEAAAAATAAALRADYVTADVTDPDSLAAAFRTVADRHGKVGGLVNSAGVTRTGPSETFTPADWRAVIDIDLSGTFYACQAVHPYLAERTSIVNITSILASRMMPGRAAYSSAKAAVVALTRSLAVEWAPQGIRVNAIGPAWADTALFRGLVERGVVDVDAIVNKIPAGRLCSEDDVAKTALYLLDNASSAFVTGQTIYVDGGYSFAG